MYFKISEKGKILKVIKLERRLIVVIGGGGLGSIFLFVCYSILFRVMNIFWKLIEVVFVILNILDVGDCLF